MVRSAGTYAAPLVCALLAQQPLATSAGKLEKVLSELKGKTKVHCPAVCEAVGGSYHGWSSWWSGQNAVTTCKCSSGDLQVDCTVGAPSYTYDLCCVDGNNCGQVLEPDPAEDKLAIGIDDSTAADLAAYGDEKDVSEAGVPDCGKCPGSSYQLTKQESAAVLDLHNKMRNAVGTPPLAWSCDLMCQVQKHASKCIYDHSPSYYSDIPAGENMASGTDGELATWMWFSEYGKVPPTQHASDAHGASHFTAVVWKDTKKLGCGVCKSSNINGGGYYFCQYADNQPNYNDAWVKNVPKFHGTTAQYNKAGLDAAKAKTMFKKFDSWGVTTGNALTRFYDSEGLWAQAPSSAVLAVAGAALTCALTMAFAGLALRRFGFGAAAPDFRGLRLNEATTKDDEELACSLDEQ